MTALNRTQNQRANRFKRLIGTALLLTTLLLAGCITVTADSESGHGSSEENHKNTFVVGTNPTIDVTGFNGKIEITAGEDGVVDVDTTLKVPGRISYSAELDGNTVTVLAKKNGIGISFGSNPQAQIQVVAPSNAIIKARSSNGSVTVSGITGSGTLDTSNGTITIEDSSGEFSAETSNGSINMSNVNGEFDAETSNGKITFLGSFESESDNTFKSSNGSVDVTFADEPDLDLDARTSNGTVDSERPILATTTKKSHLVGTYGDGSASLDIVTSNGSINIH
jgi:hypothetical protein